MATKQKSGSFPTPPPPLRCLLASVSWPVYPLHAGKAIGPEATPDPSHPVMAQSLEPLMPLSPASVYSCSPSCPRHALPCSSAERLGTPMSLAPASAFTVPCDWKGLPQRFHSVIPICCLLLSSASPSPPLTHPPLLPLPLPPSPPRRPALSSHGVTSRGLWTVRSPPQAAAPPGRPG